MSLPPYTATTLKSSSLLSFKVLIYILTWRASSLKLNEKVPGWQDDQVFAEVVVSANLFLSEPLDNRQGKSDGLTWSCSVSRNYVTALVNVLEGFVLNGEEPLDSFLLQHFEYSLVFDEICELAFFGESVFIVFTWLLFDLDRLWVDVSQFPLWLILKFGDAVNGLSFAHCWFKFDYFIISTINECVI